MTDTRPTIPPEVSKRYVTRCGKTTGILMPYDAGYPFGDDTASWTASGLFDQTKKFHEYDLVAEYTGNAEPWTVPDDASALDELTTLTADLQAAKEHVWDNQREKAADRIDTCLRSVEALIAARKGGA